MRTRLKFLGQLLFCVGIGAMLLHTTLSHLSQMGDEMSMLALSFYSLKELRPVTSSYLIYPLLTSYCLFSKYFAVFFLTFTGLQLLIAKYASAKINRKDKSLKGHPTSYRFTLASYWLFFPYRSLMSCRIRQWWRFLVVCSTALGPVAAMEMSAREEDHI